MQITNVLDLSVETASGLASVRELLPRGISVVESIPTHPFLVRINRAGLTQVLAALMLNSAEAMDHRGAVTVSLGGATLNVPAAEALDIERGAYALLSIGDTGRGIPSDVIPSLFGPLPASTRVGRGMRLGLPAAGTIVRDWNGAVSVRSTLGLGSIFTIYLPLLPSAQVALKRAC